MIATLSALNGITKICKNKETWMEKIPFKKSNYFLFFYTAQIV
jgi:hypothetical protein